MKNLRTKLARFFLKNRNVGIPNLMLFIAIGNLLVYILNYFVLPGLSQYLVFDRAAILQGQVWRLITYIFAYDAGYILMTIFGLFCYFSLGRSMENAWGTLRFNLFYLTGVLLMDGFCMIFGGQASVNQLNLSLLLGVATLYPDSRIFLFGFIPIRAWIFGFVYACLTLHNVILLAIQGSVPYCFFPLVALGNYFLFFGKDVVNLLPPAWRHRRKKPNPKVVDVPPVRKASQPPRTEKTKTPYTHRCTVCGRTDVSNPELEFRYCSRCKGYFCYCEDHINTHNHIE